MPENADVLADPSARETIAKLREFRLRQHTCVTTLSDLCDERWNLIEMGQKYEVFIMSVDVRNSTKLLQSRKLSDFKEFMVDVCSRLKSVVVANHGIHYQYTGDGILAVFPCFYTGPDAGYYVLRAASHCHKQVVDPFDSIKRKGTHYPSGVGIGIGIGFDHVYIVDIMQEFVIMGEELVGACRVSGCPADTTIVTNKALERLQPACRRYAEFEETDLAVKNESGIVGHEVTYFNESYECAQPAWLLD